MAGFRTERNEIERRIRNLERLVRNRPTATAAPAALVFDVTMTGALDGVNKTFTLSRSDLIPTSVELELRGSTLKYTTDFTVSGATLTMVEVPFDASDPAAIKTFAFFFVRSAQRGA